MCHQAPIGRYLQLLLARITESVGPGPIPQMALLPQPVAFQLASRRNREV